MSQQNPFDSIILGSDPKIVTSKDYWREKNVDHAYCILITGRCGSTLLGKIISNLDLFGTPDEYFTEEMLPHLVERYKTASLSKILANVLATSKRNNIFGFQIDPLRLEWLLEYWDLRQAVADGSLSLATMRRYDLLSQAYSYLASKETGIWHILSNDVSIATSNSAELLRSRDQSTLRVFARRLFIELHLILNSESRITAFTKSTGVKTAGVTYEEFISDRFSCLYKLLRGLGADDYIVEGLIRNKDSIFSDPTRKILHQSKEILFDYIYKHYRDVSIEINEARVGLADEVASIVKSLEG